MKRRNCYDRLTVTGSVMELTRQPAHTCRPRPGGGVRGQITKLSRASNGRLRKTIFQHSSRKRWYHITLTFPEPKSPQDAKADLRNLWKRFKRHRYRDDCYAVWKMEFQERGVVHFHIVLTSTRDVPIALKALQKWFRDEWADIVRGNGSRGRLPRTRVQIISAKSIVKYLCGPKESYQNQLPEQYESAGRWWGQWGDADLPRTVIRLKSGSYWKLRRVLRHLRRMKAIGGCRNAWAAVLPDTIPKLIAYCLANGWIEDLPE